MKNLEIASSKNIKVGNVIIFKCDEFRNGDVCEFDGHVQFIDEKGVAVVYLSGYRSRNDHIPWSDILAKLDRRRSYTNLTNAPYSGHFIEFSSATTEE